MKQISWPHVSQISISVGCGREEKPHRRSVSEESAGGFAAVVPSSGLVEQKHHVEEPGRNAEGGCNHPSVLHRGCVIHVASEILLLRNFYHLNFKHLGRLFFSPIFL